MNEARHIGALEAMLFAHAEPVELERLADALRLSTVETQDLLERLQNDTMNRKAVLLYCVLGRTAGR